MSSSPFSIELHGSDYVIFHKDQIIAAFSTIDAAFEAKYDFETRPQVTAEEKMPPSIRWAKEHLYVSAV
ncbi:hypothetical protein [Thiomicrorhabdus indica]|uniref:hypothetical protein n=1 Tax=Thiomicrorhabdus indica TaxID=2267253 RepID=UPI00102DC8FD|nr:hypothetical protein [Thiomicrorhabdus indica]